MESYTIFFAFKFGFPHLFTWFVHGPYLFSFIVCFNLKGFSALQYIQFLKTLNNRVFPDTLIYIMNFPLFKRKVVLLKK